MEKHSSVIAVILVVIISALAGKADNFIFPNLPRSRRSVDSPGRYFRRFRPIGYQPLDASSQSQGSINDLSNRSKPMTVRDLKGAAITACFDTTNDHSSLKCGDLDSDFVQDAVLNSLREEEPKFKPATKKMPVLLSIQPSVEQSLRYNVKSSDIARIIQFAHQSPLSKQSRANGPLSTLPWAEKNFNTAKNWLRSNTAKIADWLESNKQLIGDWRKNQEATQAIKLVWLGNEAKPFKLIDAYVSLPSLNSQETNLIIDDIGESFLKNIVINDDLKIARISENQIHNPAGSQPEVMLYLTEPNPLKSLASYAKTNTDVTSLPQPYFVDLDQHATAMQNQRRKAETSQIQLTLANLKPNILKMTLFDYSTIATRMPSEPSKVEPTLGNLVQDATKQRYLSNGGKYEIKAVLLESKSDGKLKPHSVLYETLYADNVPKKVNIFKVSDIPVLQMSTTAVNKDISMLLMLDSTGPEGLNNLDFSSMNQELNKETDGSTLNAPARNIPSRENESLPFPDFTNPFNDLNSPFIPSKNYVCPFDKSIKQPTSAHKVRPGDIKVIATLGDSLSAGSGAGGKQLADVLLQYTGISFTGGGDGTLDTMTTIPNIIKYFNPDLFGYSIGVITPPFITEVEKTVGDKRFPLPVNGETMLNAAVPGAKVRGIPAQARDLVQRLRSVYTSQFDLVHDWKLINVFIGHNDLCQSCLNGSDPLSSAAAFKADLENALDYLHNNLNRTIVNLITNVNITILKMTHSNSYCYLIHTVECPCITNKYNDAYPKLLKLVEAYQRLTHSLAVSGIYDDRDDFTVINQPALDKLTVPFKLVNGRQVPDLSFNAPDCFHLGKKGHAVAAKIVWNSMLSPIGQKPQPGVVENVLLECPDSNCPFIRTNRNSDANCSDSYFQSLTSANIREYGVVRNNISKRVPIVQFSAQKNFNPIAFAQKMEEKTHFSWPTLLGMLTLLAVAAFTISGVVIYFFKRLPRNPRRHIIATEKTPLLFAEDSL